MHHRRTALFVSTLLLAGAAGCADDPIVTTGPATTTPSSTTPPTEPRSQIDAEAYFRDYAENAREMSATAAPSAVAVAGEADATSYPIPEPADARPDAGAARRQHVRRRRRIAMGDHRRGP